MRIPCPKCRGAGDLPAFTPGRFVVCGRCKGACWIDDGRPEPYTPEFGQMVQDKKLSQAEDPFIAGIRGRTERMLLDAQLKLKAIRASGEGVRAYLSRCPPSFIEPFVREAMKCARLCYKEYQCWSPTNDAWMMHAIHEQWRLVQANVPMPGIKASDEQRKAMIYWCGLMMLAPGGQTIAGTLYVGYGRLPQKPISVVRLRVTL